MGPSRCPDERPSIGHHLADRPRNPDRFRTTFRAGRGLRHADLTSERDQAGTDRLRDLASSARLQDEYMPAVPPSTRAVVFDVGETLVDETRNWSRRAELVGVTAFSLMGALGALIERDEPHSRLWELLGVESPGMEVSLDGADLYPDALRCLRAIRRVGLVVGIAGNQPAGIEAQLRALGFEADFIASSAAWGVEKPSAEFFTRIVGELACEPAAILYVGDRLDNDVLPARAAGMRTAFVRRGPWGYVHAQRQGVSLADLRIDSLDELAAIMTAKQGRQAN